MSIKNWLNKEIKNKDIYGIDTEDFYLNTNKFQVDKIFNNLLIFSKNNNQTYIDKMDNKSNKLINIDIYNSFVKFCYNNS